MTPQDWDRCKQIFCDALNVSGEERFLFVERACEGDRELYERLLKMLAAEQDDTSPLDVGAADRLVVTPQLTEPLISGDIVGRYRVLRRIGQGGTSLVYLAEHIEIHSPRRFAIKVIASAFLAGQQQRFERECEILSAIDHPGIARILDRGVTASGWPYLVLDYIDGAPIHRYCIDHKLAPPEIVRLALDCCRAVKYIHDNQIVHCDLKPSNILVDSSGSPRILDFGIARLVDPGRSPRSGSTTRGVRPLTPSYASPEQLAGALLSASTDIYSLGVVLYEALTQTLPFDNSGYPWEEVSRRMADQDPAPPSKARRTHGPIDDDPAFAKQLLGDLDGIVLKTLAHDPANRYASVDGLIADLTRYLAGDVVEARRSTLVNRAGRVVKRHRRELIEVLAVVFAIAAVLSISAWSLHRQQRDAESERIAELRAMIHSFLPPNLPFSSRERALLVENISNSIERVTPMASRYPDLIPDLADALLKTGDLLGNPYQVSLGRADDARTCYQRASNLVDGRQDARSAGIRARASLGLGDTYGNSALVRDPVRAAVWYRRAVSEAVPGHDEMRMIAAAAHGRLGALCELLGEPGAASAEYREGLGILPPETEPNPPVSSAFALLVRVGMEPPDASEATYSRVMDLLDQAWGVNDRDIRLWHAAIAAHLSWGLTELRSGRASDADSEFNKAERLAGWALEWDAEDLSAQRELAVARRRRALIPAGESRLAEADALRRGAADALGREDTASDAAAPPRPAPPRSAELYEDGGRFCADATERLSAGQSPAPLKAGDLLIANQGPRDTPAAVYAFSPASLEMSVVARGGYLADLVDVASGSPKEFYVLSRNPAGPESIVRLRFEAGRWLQKPISCGGYIQRAAALAYRDGALTLAAAFGNYTRLISIDPGNGRQTLIARTGAFLAPGRIVPSAAGILYLSLYWPGEGGPAEVVAFNPRTRVLAVIHRDGLLDDPLALAIAPGEQLIVGDRGWTGAGGNGRIVILSRGNEQKTVWSNPELSRVTAMAAASLRETWYATLATPYSPSGLFKLNLVTGTRELIMSGGTRDALIGEIRALARVE